jgi:hypothetical protein
MQSFKGLTIALFIVLPGCATGFQGGDARGSRPAVDRPGSDAEARGLRRLSSREIRRQIVGRHVRLASASASSRMSERVESFHYDGRYTAVRRGDLRSHGTFLVRSDKLCVSVYSAGQFCYLFFTDRNGAHFRRRDRQGDRIEPIIVG